MRSLDQVLKRAATLGLAVDVGARRHPSVPVWIDRPLDLAPELGLRLDLATLGRLVREASGSLAALDVAPGERVVILKRNHIDIPLLASAVARIGAVPVLLSESLDAIAAADLIRRLGARLLITDVASWRDGVLADLDRSALPSVVVLLDADTEDTTSWPAPPPVVPEAVLPTEMEQPALVTHTSGTTDIPKLVVQSVRSFAEVTWLSVGRSSVLRVREPVGVHLSFSHVRSNTGLCALVLCGWPLLAMTSHDVDRVGALFEELRPEIVETHPNTFVLWESLAERSDSPLANVVCFHSTFDAAHPRTIKRLLGASRRRNPIYIQAYGQSESGPATMRPYMRFSTHGADGRCVGHAHPLFSRFRIRGERGRAAIGAEGTIEVRTKGQAAAYLDQEELYSSKVADGWWNMEDIGYRTRWGCLHLVDREIEQTVGIQSLLEIEDILIGRMPGLAEVVLIPSAEGGAVPLVCTFEDRPFDRDMWGAATRDLPPLASPRHIRFGELPRTATWKVRRLHVREMMHSGTLAQIA